MSDENLERLMIGLGLEFRLVDDLDLGSISVPDSERDQYRLVTVDADTVNRYAQDMQRGDVFPPIVVRPWRGRARLIGGMHRDHAHRKAGHTTAAAYVVECTAASARRLAYEDNRRHGLTLKPSERAELAARMVDLDGVPVAEAARTVGTGEHQVRQAVAALAANRRAATLEVADFDRLPYPTRERLGQLDDDSVFVEASKAVIATRMGSPTVQRLVSQLTAADGPVEQLDRLEEITQARVGFTGGRGRTRTDRIRLLDALFEVLDTNPDRVAGDVTDPDQQQVLSDRLKRTARHLMTIDQALTP